MNVQNSENIITIFDVSDSTSVGVRWKKWIKKFENYLVVTNVTDDTRKTAMLNHYAGDDVAEILENLPEPVPVVENCYKKAVKQLNDYFIPKTNIDFEIYNLREQQQMPGESLMQFYTRLCALSSNCEFADKDAEIKWIITSKTTSSTLRRYALREQPTLAQLLEYGKTLELTEQRMTEMEKRTTIKEENASDVNAVYRRSQRKPKSNNFNKQSSKSHEESKQQCKFCGYSWHKDGLQSCPARNSTCRSCHKSGHYEKVCLSKKKNRFNHQHEIKSVCVVSTPNKQSSNKPVVHMFINNVATEFMADSGSAVNIINKSTFNKLNINNQQLQSTEPIYAFGTEAPINILGKFKVTLFFKGNCIEDEVHVFDGEAQQLLSFEASKKLNVMKVSYQITNGISINMNFIEQNFPNIVKGVGILKNHEVHLHVDKNVKPIAQRHRRIPMHLRENVESEINRLLQENIIEKVDGPTPWISPVVLVPKPSKPNGIRLCVDMRAANTAIIRERHITPTIDDICFLLNGASCFSKIDLRDGYHQLELDKDSRSITTFSTHIGLFQYKRLSFGICSASEIFQNTIYEILMNIPGTVNISDDILVFGRDKKEHDKALLNVLSKLQEHNLTINTNKCEFNKTSITYFGFVFSKNGVSPDPNKVQIFNEMSSPKNVSETRSLIGMLNYLQKFLPNLATHNKLLRELTLAKSNFTWTDAHEAVFKELKQMLLNARALAYFDIKKNTHLHVDAGPVGLGAILSQTSSSDQHVNIVSFASRALTEVEQRYSQIEKEMLAISWGMQHFHTFLYGTEFTLHTDQKPIVNILKNPLINATARIERLYLKVQQYVFKVIHQEGKSNPSDYLSRYAISKELTSSQSTENYVNFVTKNNIPDHMSLQEIQEHTKKDHILQLIQLCIENGKNFNNEPELSNFKNIQNELSINNGIILKGCKILLPESLQARAIEIAHSGHLGMVKTKQILRSKVWFKTLDKQVENAIQNCPTCAVITDSTSRDPIAIPELAKNPMEQVNMDYAGPFPNGKYLFIMIDEFSKYPFVEVVSSTKFCFIESVLVKTFSMFGSPKKARTDNGPPFNSSDFDSLLKKFNIQHIKSTPYWPEANGSAERFVRTLKKCLIGSQLETNNFLTLLNTFLANFRSAPSSVTGKSPYELMFGRNPKTSLPDINDFENNNFVHTKTMENKLKAKEYADQSRHTKPNNLRVGDKVICKQPKLNKLTPKYDPVPYHITKKNGTKITAEREGKVIKRNASFFKQINYPINTFKKSSNEVTMDVYEELTRQQNFTKRFVNIPEAENIDVIAQNQPEAVVTDDGDNSNIEVPAQVDVTEADLPESSRPRRRGRKPDYLNDYDTN